MHRGIVLDEALRRQRVTRDEVLSVLRCNGVTAIEDAVAVVLETDGSFSVLEAGSTTPRSTISDVPGSGPQNSAASLTSF